MSLINKMLRDLDARHAPTVDRSALPGAVHVLQLPRRAPGPPSLVLAILVAAAGGWYWLGAANAPVAVPVSPAPAPLARVVPPAVPVAAAPAPVPVAPPAPAAALGPATASNDSAAPTGSAVPAKPVSKAVASAAAPKQKAAPPEAIAPKHGSATLPETKAASATPASTPAPAVADAAPAGPSSIDRHARGTPAADSGEIEYRKAMAALRRGSGAEAMEGLQAALRADKQHHSARQALLSLLVERQQWGEAQTLVEEGLAVDPAQTGWAIILARLQLESGKLADARETLARHAAYAAQNPDYQSFYALVLQRLKRFGEAAARYRIALGLKPAEARWWYGLGLSLEADQKPQEAREAFLRAREAGSLPPELASAVEQRLR